MLNTPAAWLAMAVLAAACTAEPEAPTAPPLPHLAPEARILAFGDSLTEGVGAPPGRDYPAQLAQLIGRTVIRSGISGETTQGAARRLEQALQRHQPDLLLLCSGANDFLRGLPEQQAERRLEQMVALAQSHGVPTVLIGVPYLGHTLLGGQRRQQAAADSAAAPLYYRIATKHQLWLEDAAVRAALSKTGLVDIVSRHPNARGYRHLAKAIAALLVRSGALRREELRR